MGAEAREWRWRCWMTDDRCGGGGGHGDGVGGRDWVFFSCFSFFTFFFTFFHFFFSFFFFPLLPYPQSIRPKAPVSGTAFPSINSVIKGIFPPALQSLVYVCLQAPNFSHSTSSRMTNFTRLRSINVATPAVSPHGLEQNFS